MEDMKPSRPMVNDGPYEDGARMHRGGSKMPWIVLLVVVMVIAALAVIFRDQLFSKSGVKDQYQAVFLTNGQVYFGKLSNATGQYLTLNDIFYLQVTQPPLQGSQQQGQPAQQPQLSLVKLGNELHGPEDTMHISRDQVLFYEDLKDNGRVVQAITEYKKNPNNSTAPAPAAAPAPAPAAATPPSAAQ